MVRSRGEEIVQLCKAWETCFNIDNVANERARRRKFREARKRMQAEDNQNWQFDEEVFQRLNKQYGPFTVDACCDDEGRNRLVKGHGTRFFSPSNSCLEQVVTGEKVWINPPFNDSTVTKMETECKDKNSEEYVKQLAD